MPFYDYKCTECGAVLADIYRKILDNVSIFDCPSCGEVMKQQYGSSTFEFKGSGFYETDYHKKSKSVPDKENDSGKSKERKQDGK